MVSFTVFKGSKDGKIIKSTSSREIKADEVLVKISHSGVCGTDQHLRPSGIVLGHEGVGTVEQLGSAVTTLSKGDRVGWGYVHSSCGECKQCLTGHENICPTNQTYGATNTDQGSFGTYAVWQAAYIFKIPPSIASEHAAPLMCGGATVFHALRSSNTAPSDCVGVIGVGGLGHLAIQFASKMGCNVVVFSGTDSKKDEAMKLGAHQFVVTKGKDKLDIGRTIDHLIVTTSMPPDWSKMMPLMSPLGAIYPLTVSGDDLKLPFMPILNSEVRILGTRVSPRQHHREMIEFAAQHGIKPIVETFPMTETGIEQAMEKLSEGKMRYRGVLVV